MKNSIESNTDSGRWRARFRKMVAASAVIGVTIAFAGGTALARHHGWDNGHERYESHEWHGDRDWDDRGPAYVYNGPDYYYVPPPDYYYEPDPYELLSAAAGLLPATTLRHQPVLRPVVRRFGGSSFWWTIPD